LSCAKIEPKQRAKALKSNKNARKKGTSWTSASWNGYPRMWNYLFKADGERSQ